MEGVVLMMHAALDWALYSGSYSWFNTLLEFMIRLGQATLGEQPDIQGQLQFHDLRMWPQK